jgi:hypothetical protein
MRRGAGVFMLRAMRSREVVSRLPSVVAARRGEGFGGAGGQAVATVNFAEGGSNIRPASPARRAVHLDWEGTDWRGWFDGLGLAAAALSLSEVVASPMSASAGAALT